MIGAVNDLPMIFIVFGPALLGLGALVTGILLLKRPEGAPRNSTARLVVGSLALLAAFGVGACYAVTWLETGIH